MRKILLVINTDGKTDAREVKKVMPVVVGMTDYKEIS